MALLAWERQLKTVPLAKLIVWPKRWWVELALPGPDRRYTPHIIRWEPRHVQQFVAALEEAWGRLEAEAGRPVVRRVYAAMNIVISFGEGARGLFLQHHHGFVSSRSEVDAVIEELQGLEDVAAEIRTQVWPTKLRSGGGR